MNLLLLILGLGIIFKVKFYVFICLFPALISFIISNNFKFKTIKVIPINFFNYIYIDCIIVKY